MKVLFADISDLYRYSTILIAKEQFPHIKIEEAATFASALNILEQCEVTKIVLNSNVLPHSVTESLQILRDKQPNLQILLIVDCTINPNQISQAARFIYGVLDFQESLENNKRVIDEFIQSQY